MLDHYEQLIHEHSELLLENARIERRLSKALEENRLLHEQCLEVGYKLDEALERLRARLAH